MKKIIVFTLIIALVLCMTGSRKISYASDDIYEQGTLVRNLYISNSAQERLSKLGIQLHDNDVVDIIETKEISKYSNCENQFFTCLKISSEDEMGRTDTFLLSYYENERGDIEAGNSPFELTNSTQYSHLTFNMGNSNEISVAVTNAYKASGAPITGTYLNPLSVQWLYFKNSSCSVSDIRVDFSTIGNLCEADGTVVTYGTIHSIVKNVSNPSEGVIYLRNYPIPNNRKMEITGWLGPAMTDTVTTTINGYEFSRILNAMNVS